MKKLSFIALLIAQISAVYASNPDPVGGGQCYYHANGNVSFSYQGGYGYGGGGGWEQEQWAREEMQRRREAFRKWEAEELAKREAKVKEQEEDKRRRAEWDALPWDKKIDHHEAQLPGLREELASSRRFREREEQMLKSCKLAVPRLKSLCHDNQEKLLDWMIKRTEDSVRMRDEYFAQQAAAAAAEAAYQESQRVYRETVARNEANAAAAAAAAAANPPQPTFPKHEHHHVFHAQPEQVEILQPMYEELKAVEPTFERQYNSREFGLVAIENSDNSYATGDQSNGQFYKDIAIGFTQIALGVNPVTSFAQSSYEFLSGKNFVSGEPLSQMDRSIAFVGIVTGGAGRSVVQAGRGMRTIFEGAAHILENRQAATAALEHGIETGNKVKSILSGISPKYFKITGIKTAEEINAVKFPNYPDTPPFQLKTHVIEFVTTEPVDMVRVHGANNQMRAWVMRKSSIQGLSPAQIQEKFALPNLPSEVTELRIPKNTPMLRGQLEYEWFDRDMGRVIKRPEGVQYFIDKEYDKSWISVPRRHL